jgi:hypothetical protein
VEGEGGVDAEESEAERREAEEGWEPLTSVIGVALSPAGRGMEGGGVRLGVGRGDGSLVVGWGDGSQAVWVASSDASASQSYVCVYPMGVMMGMVGVGARGDWGFGGNGLGFAHGGGFWMALQLK